MQNRAALASARAACSSKRQAMAASTAIRSPIFNLSPALASRGAIMCRCASLRRRRPRLLVRGLLLALPHGGVLPAARQQFAVPSALDDAAVFQHDDLVGV